jgi:hypothetical protein
MAQRVKKKQSEFLSRWKLRWSKLKKAICESEIFEKPEPYSKAGTPSQQPQQPTNCKTIRLNLVII